MNPIITTSELLEIIDQPNLIIFDARVGKDAYPNYLEKHIKGAKYINLDLDFAKLPQNPVNGSRHPLPLVEVFKDTLEQFGVNEHSRIVIYDAMFGANAAARLWWMIKAFGIQQVQVLSGGFQQAEKDQLPMGTDEESLVKSQMDEKLNWQLPTKSIDEVEQALKEHSATVIDVRDAYRYNGESEPIDLVAGHIPGAINIPFSENLDESGNFLPAETLRRKYEQFLEGKPSQLIIHCGSGVTACHTILALCYAGFDIPSLYVGSWSEWSRRGKPIAKNI